MNLQNIKAGEEFVQPHGFKVCMGTHYLGGYIGYDKTKGDWLKKRTYKWERDIRDIRKKFNKYPQ